VPGDFPAHWHEMSKRTEASADGDGPQRDDLDGGGNLSEAALAEFERFFLSVRIDQVPRMERLVQQDRPRVPSP
jgi:hypothetical protein